MAADRPTTEVLTERLKSEAMRLGFNAVGIVPAVAPPGYPSFLEWLGKGHSAGMTYLERQAPARAHPESILPGVRSVVVAMFVYGTRSDAGPPQSATTGRIARYAQGGDYHELVWRRLEALLEWLQAEVPGAQGRAVADSAPLMERDFARLAGLGWIAKNTMLIHPKLGSYTVLGALLLDLELDYDRPFEGFHCGTCTRCLDACPTGAFVGPFELDARRCISYWTIEHKGDFPERMDEALHGWAFGCDLCQDVCPWNRKAPNATEPVLAPREEWVNPDLIAWLEEDAPRLSRRLKATALRRTKRSGLVRNAAAILADRHAVEAVPALTSLLDDAEPTVRVAARRALERIREGERAGPAIQEQGAPESGEP